MVFNNCFINVSIRRGSITKIINKDTLHLTVQKIKLF